MLWKEFRGGKSREFRFQQSHFMPELIDVAHISKRGTSMRVTLLKRVADLIGTKEEKIIGYYRGEERVYIQRME